MHTFIIKLSREQFQQYLENRKELISRKSAPWGLAAPWFVVTTLQLQRAARSYASAPRPWARQAALLWKTFLPPALHLHSQAIWRANTQRASAGAPSNSTEPAHSCGAMKTWVLWIQQYRNRNALSRSLTRRQPQERRIVVAGPAMEAELTSWLRGLTWSTPPTSQVLLLLM